MTDCCEVPGAAAEVGTACPTCGDRGVPVELRTVKALLTEAAMRQVSATPHRFCGGPACPTVYFDAAGQVFGTSDIRVPVWQKQPFGRRMICYGFGENKADIRAEIERAGRSEAPVLLAGVGAGALGAAAVRLEPLRPVFLAVTAVLLALAFYGAYRPSSARACEADGGCSPPSGRAAKIVLWVVAALVGLLVAFPYHVGFLP